MKRCILNYLVYHILEDSYINIRREIDAKSVLNIKKQEKSKKTDKILAKMEFIEDENIERFADGSTSVSIVQQS